MAVELQQQMHRAAELLRGAEKRAAELEAHALREQELRRAAENELQLSEARKRALEAGKNGRDFPHGGTVAARPRSGKSSSHTRPPIFPLYFVIG